MKILVKDKFIDENGNENLKIIPLVDYCNIGGKKINAIMYDLEEFLSEILNKKINLKKDFPEIREKILDGSGFIMRIPDGIIIEFED